MKWIKKAVVAFSFKSEQISSKSVISCIFFCSAFRSIEWTLDLRQCLMILLTKSRKTTKDGKKRLLAQFYDSVKSTNNFLQLLFFCSPQRIDCVLQMKSKRRAHRGTEKEVELAKGMHRRRTSCRVKFALHFSERNVLKEESHFSLLRQKRRWRRRMTDEKVMSIPPPLYELGCATKYSDRMKYATDI